jgi:hypothetical protein
MPDTMFREQGVSSSDEDSFSTDSSDRIEDTSDIADALPDRVRRIWENERLDVDADYVLASDEEWATDDEIEVAPSEQLGLPESAEQLERGFKSFAFASASAPKEKDASVLVSAADVIDKKDAPPVEKVQADKNAALTLASQHLSQEEQARAKEVFRHCDLHNEGFIDEDGVCVALSLLGLREPEENISALFKRRDVDNLDESTFLVLLSDLRSTAVDEEQLSAIEAAFSDLYYGTLQSNDSQFVVEQRDALGRPFILAEDLRKLLVTHGDILLDEEADRLILDCKPIYTLEANGSRVGRIFFDQYRAMLLPGPIL